MLLTILHPDIPNSHRLSMLTISLTVFLFSLNHSDESQSHPPTAPLLIISPAKVVFWKPLDLKRRRVRYVSKTSAAILIIDLVKAFYRFCLLIPCIFAFASFQVGPLFSALGSRRQQHREAEF
jgi:hypothetical protein